MADQSEPTAQMSVHEAAALLASMEALRVELAEARSRWTIDQERTAAIVARTRRTSRLALVAAAVALLSAGLVWRESDRRHDEFCLNRDLLRAVIQLTDSDSAGIPFTEIPGWDEAWTPAQKEYLLSLGAPDESGPSPFVENALALAPACGV